MSTSYTNIRTTRPWARKPRRRDSCYLCGERIEKGEVHVHDLGELRPTTRPVRRIRIWLDAEPGPPMLHWWGEWFVESGFWGWGICS